MSSKYYLFVGLIVVALQIQPVQAGGLLKKIFGAKDKCCEPAPEPTCCEPAPEPTCCEPAPEPKCCEPAPEPACCEAAPAPAPCCAFQSQALPVIAYGVVHQHSHYLNATYASTGRVSMQSKKIVQSPSMDRPSPTLKSLPTTVRYVQFQR